MILNRNFLSAMPLHYYVERHFFFFYIGNMWKNRCEIFIFDDVNKKLQSSIENFRENFKDKEINKLSTDDKETFINILSKIESLESQILPKANLINSFSNYKI